MGGINGSSGIMKWNGPICSNQELDLMADGMMAVVVNAGEAPPIDAGQPSAYESIVQRLVQLPAAFSAPKILRCLHTSVT